MKSIFNRFLSVLCLLTLGLSSILAVPAYRGWQTVSQPDGSTITIRRMGDEFFHYWENEAGQQVQIDADGWWTVLDKPATQSELSKKKQASRAYNHHGDPRKTAGNINLAPRGLVILVNFSDVTFKTGNTQLAMSDLMNAESYTYNSATGSVREFFKAQSNGAYVPDFDVVGPYTLTNNRAHYGGNDSNDDDLLAGDMIVEACKAADADGVDFTKYNNDGDNEVDFVYVIYAGVGEADATPDVPNAVWPHNWTLESAYYYNNCTYAKSARKVDNLYINNYACSGELEGTATYRCPIGTIAHEFGHVLGLPDYYVTDENASNNKKNYTPGAWHIMDYGSYNNEGRTPPNYSPHDKYYFGWSTPTLLAKDAKQNCTLTTTYGSAYQITGGTTSKGATASDRIWYLENRQKSGWDKYLPGHGMVVWEVTYNSSNWTNNAPNNSSVGYTVVTANNLTRPYTPCVYQTTASSTSATPFPGTSNVTSYTPATGCALTAITETSDNPKKITFKYNGGASTTDWSYTLYGDHCTYPADGSVLKNAALNLTITPASGYTLADASCWEVTMGGTALTYGTGFTYNTGTGAFSIASVTGDVEILVEGKRTVTWNVQGATTTSLFSEGAALVLPTTPSDCSGTGGKKFVGWTASSTVSGSAPADLFTSAGTKTVTANTTYYAVYATASGSGGGGSSTGSKTFTFSSIASANGWTNGEAYTSVVDAPVTITAEGGGNNGKWYTSSGGSWRMYSGGTVRISVASGSVTSVTSSPSCSFSISNDEATFSPTARTDFTSITVNYSTSGGSGTTYSDYSLTCTTCTLTGITLNTSGVTTSFTVGDSFTSEGLVVTASYEEGGCSNRTVTPTSVSSPDMSTTGTKTITVTYTEGDVTKTKTYEITVEPAPTYTIRFFDGTTQIGANQEVTSGQSAIKPSDPADCTDNGYTFVGWYTSKLADDNTTVTSGWITDFTATQNQDYYAVYSHTVSSGSGGSSNESVTFSDLYTSDTDVEGTKISIGTHTSVTFTKGSANSKYYASGSSIRWYGGGSCLVESDAGNLTNITFSFGSSDGSNAITASGYSAPTWTGDAASVTFNQGGTSGNRRIAGISTTISGGGSSTTYYTGTKDCTLPTSVTVTFNANGGEGTMADQTIPYNEATALNANTFTRTGYTFQGWATSTSGAKTYDDEQNVTLTSNIDLYAVWQINSHNVTFSTPTGATSVTVNSQSTSPQTADYGSIVTIAVTPATTHVVNSVTVTGDITVTDNGDNTYSFTMPDNDVTVTVTMSIIPTYTVTWSANGTTTTEQYAEGAAITFPATATGCDGKVFVGWSASEVAETDTKPTLVSSATMGTSPLTYYAVFAESSGASENEYVKGTSSDLQAGKQVLIVYHNSNKALSNVESGTGYAGVTVTPDGSGKVTTTNTNIIWTVSPQSSGYYFHQGDNYVNAGESSGGNHYLYVDEYPDAWTLTDGSVSGTYILHSSEDPGYQLEYYQDKFTIYTGTSGTAYEMDFYVPAASYSGYTTTCVQCDYKVTLTKGAEENGTFTLSKADGSYNNCTSNFVVTVSGITPAEHYYCTGVTATGGNSTVTGPDGSGNYTVTYTKNNNITSTITANFAPEPKYTVTWSANGDDSNTAEYYEGEDIVFPSSASGCDGKVFRGWSATTIAETDDEPTYVTSASMPAHDVTYYAVFAEATEGGGSVSYSKATSIAAGDKVIFVCEDESVEMSSISTTSTKYGEGNAYTTAPDGLFVFEVEVGASTGTFAFKNDTKYLYWGSGNSLNVYNTTATANNSWTVSINSNGNATILNSSNTDRRLVWNHNNPRFACYENPTIGTTYYEVQIYKQSGGVSYSGYTTSCGASISAPNVGWITATKGQKVKREISVAAKNFETETTLTATCENNKFNVSLSETAVPAGPTGLTTTLTVEYTPSDFSQKDENVDIVLTAGEKTKTIKVSGRSLPEEFIIIAKKYDKWYAVPANMNNGEGQYDGIEVVPNNETTPTFVPTAPSTIIYSLNSVANGRYATTGQYVRLAGLGNKGLWANGRANATSIYNNAVIGESNDGHYEWQLVTTDGIRYSISNPAHPDAAAGRKLALGGVQYGLYKESTTFFLVPAGCTSQPQEVNVSPRRTDATFSWVSNASSVAIEIYTDDAMTTLAKSATAKSSPYVFTGLNETTEYWFKLIPGSDVDCAVTGTFKTSGPIIDITEWKEDGVVLFIDKGDVNPVIVIDGQEEHGSITGGGGNATELFFAKYFEGAGSMKLLSIFNGTNNPISLANYKFVDRHAGGGETSFGGDTEYELASLGNINAGQEIIFFSRPKGNNETELIACSKNFLDGIASKSDASNNPRWIECAEDKFASKAITFNGNDALLLLKGSDTIDVIGALGTPGASSNCRSEDAWSGTIKNMDYGKSPSDPVFEQFYNVSSKTPSSRQDSIDLLNAFGINLGDEEISITTARCIFFRDNRVTSGDSAVAMNNGGDFKTFTTHEEGGKTYSAEWYGRSVCMTSSMRTAAGVSSDAEATCNSYQDIANMDYNDYYIDYTSTIEEGKTLDQYNYDPETKLYDIPIPTLSDYTCLNIRFQLRKDGQVLTETAQQVPIIVSGNVDTNDPLFSELVVDKTTSQPSYAYSLERCKTCDVIVLGSATLTKGEDDDEKDVPEVGNIKIYPGGKLVVPEGTNYTVNSLAMRRQEDNLSIADIKGGLNIETPNSTFLDIRIDPSNWHYFTLPYDCNIRDIRFVNDDVTIPAIGTDFRIGTYDGEHRAATQSASWVYLNSEDVLKAGLGYIIGLPGSGKVQRELRFPMANEVITAEKEDKDIAGFHAWGGDKSDEELRPNHKGWNLLGAPYLTYYQTSLQDPLPMGELIHDPDEDPWQGHWVRNTGSLRYIVVPVDNGRSEYEQVNIANYHMAPFTSYFVQIGGSDPSADQTISYTASQAGKLSIIRRAVQEEVEDNHEVWFGVELVNAGGLKDETALLISDKFTDDYDIMDDLVKMRGQYYQYAQITTKPVLASRNLKGEMAFNALPDSTAAAGVPLNFFAAKDGDYRFTISGNYPLDEVKSAYLYDNDNATQKWHNLMESDYTFTTKRGDNTTRFMLAVTVERKQPEITTALDNMSSKLTLTTINRTLVLSGLTSESDIYVYDVSGKLLSTGQYNASASGVFRTTVENAGVYFVRVCSKDGQQTLQTIVY